VKQVNSKSIRVAIFEEKYREPLDFQINQFLKEKDVEVIDIKFSVSTSVAVENYSDVKAAMIVYKIPFDD